MQRIGVLLKKNWQLFLLIAIFCVVRLPGFDTNFKFEVEHADDFRAFESIWAKIISHDYEGLNLRGQEASYNLENSKSEVSVYHGAFYYYFHIPMAALVNFDPLKLLYFRLGLDLISVILLFKVAESLLKSRNIALITATFYTSFYWSNVYSRYIWTPSLMPVFTIISLYGYVFRKRGGIFWWLIGFGVGATSQVQVSGYWVVIYFALLLFLDKEKITKRNLLLLGFGALIPMWPSIVYEIYTGFEMIKYIVNMINFAEFTTSRNVFTSAIGSYFYNMESLLFGSNYRENFLLMKAYRILTVFSLTLVGIFSVKNILNNKLIPLSILMILPMSWAIDIYYQNSKPESYERIHFIVTPIINNLNFFLPYLAILIGLFLLLVVKRTTLFLVAIVMLGGIVYSNFSTIARNFYDEMSGDYNAGYKISSVKLIARDVGDNLFELSVNPAVGRNDEWEYLVKAYSGRHPEKYNGKTMVGHHAFPVILAGGQARIHYEILDRRYDFSKNEGEWTKIGEAGIYEIWKKHL